MRGRAEKAGKAWRRSWRRGRRVSLRDKRLEERGKRREEFQSSFVVSVFFFRIRDFGRLARVPLVVIPLDPSDDFFGRNHVHAFRQLIDNVAAELIGVVLLVSVAQRNGSALP